MVGETRGSLATNFRRTTSVCERTEALLSGKFKSESLSLMLRPPKYSIVKPPHDSGMGKVLSKDEAYYEINGYTVIREGGQMRIVGIRFFSRLF